MGVIKCFSVIFLENKTEYRPGENISGKCILDLEGELSMRKIIVTMRGEADTKWVETRMTGTGSNRYETSNTYKGHEDYFKVPQVVFGTDHDDSKVTLNSGIHEYDFSFQIPQQDLPRSYEGEYGKIVYYVKAEIDKPWAPDPDTRTSFTIVCPTAIPANQGPIERSDEKMLCCCCCASGPISVVARIDKTGYQPGEPIPLSVEFENHSSRIVRPQASLYETHTFTADYAKFLPKHPKISRKKLADLQGQPLGRGSNASWTGSTHQLKNPAVTPSLLNCRIIQVEYHVLVEVDIPSVNNNLRVELPVVIPSVPQTSYFPST